MKDLLLHVKELETKIDEKQILKKVNLKVKKGEIHVIMGPNGSGKSTLANVLMGHPKHSIINGKIIFDGECINDSGVDERAKKGIFLSFQHPEEIPGVTVENFLRSAKSSITGTNYKFFEFRKLLKDKMKMLEMKEEYLSRYLNEGFSGGEKKKNEIFQMTVLEPKLAILDETDSGLDIDAIRIVSNGVKSFADNDNAILVITHYNKILDYLKPDFVHVLVDGKIIRSGDMSLAEEIERDGYENLRKIL